MKREYSEIGKYVKGFNIADWNSILEIMKSSDGIAETESVMWRTNLGHLPWILNNRKKKGQLQTTR